MSTHDQKIAYTKKLRQYRIENRLCVYCGEPSDTGPKGSTRWCNACRNKQREMRKRLDTDSTYKRNVRIKAMDRYGRACARCGFSDHRALQFHHINGDGKEDRKRLRTPFHLCQEIVRNGVRGDIELLCANCHTIEHYTGNDYRPDNRGMTTPGYRGK